MSLAGQTVWVVGGVGAIGRGISRGLLQAGATVIVNSRDPERLERIQADLCHPDRLVAVDGSMKTPDLAAGTVERALAHPQFVGNGVLDHVVAHGAVRYWSTLQTGCDETFSLTRPKASLLDQTADEFLHASSTLAVMHFCAAQQLVPRIAQTAQAKGRLATYTFCTGDGGGHPSSLRTPMGELNSHHVWGLSAALRRELNGDGSGTGGAFNNSDLANNVWVREVRVGLQVNRPQDAREADPRQRPLSEDIGDLMAGLIVTAGEAVPRSASSFERSYAQENNGLIRMDSRAEMEKLLKEYHADKDKNIGPMPSISEFAGSL